MLQRILAAGGSAVLGKEGVPPSVASSLPTTIFDVYLKQMAQLFVLNNHPLRNPVQHLLRIW
ncbi:MAG: hypothetical protein ACRBCT_07345 [Alphaproteobacteria bacterium]